MSIQDQIAPYLNRFVLLFNQNATAKLEIGCIDGKVSVNISHELGAVVKMAPSKKPEKQQYSDVLKKKVRPSQLKRLQIRADARAAQAKVPTHENDAEKANDDNVIEAEQVKHEAENARKEAEKDKTKAENALPRNPNIVPSKAPSETECDDASAKNVITPEKLSQTLRCSLCRKTFPDMFQFNEHKKVWNRDQKKESLKVKCPLCDDRLFSCQHIMNHIGSEHERNFNWIAEEYN
jgi:hypothetical protein